MYGGMFEDGDRQYTLSDFYSLGKILLLILNKIIIIIKIDLFF